MTAYHLAIYKCAERYLAMQVASTRPTDPALMKFTWELSDGARAGLPTGKLNRWLGYVQGVLIERGLTTVEAERDFTRPFFRPLDFPEGSP